MTRILLLETSAATLSVALAEDGKVVADRVCTEPRMQSSLTAPLIKEVMDEAGIGFDALDAVCVSKGPGSYTGLRVGVSTAKGIAFGSDIPLLSIDTPDILVSSVILSNPSVNLNDPSVILSNPSVILSEAKNLFIIPMIDARRMEVYTAVYNASGERLTPIEAKIVEAGTYDEYLSQGKVLFIGDGALKCKDVITSANAVFQEAVPLASAMAPLAFKAFNERRFEDVAYFEPFYLKDFVATVSKKNLF